MAGQPHGADAEPTRRRALLVSLTAAQTTLILGIGALAFLALSMGFEKWTGMGSENWTLLGLETIFGRSSAGAVQRVCRGASERRERHEVSVNRSSRPLE